VVCVAFLSVCPVLAPTWRQTGARNKVARVTCNRGMEVKRSMVKVTRARWKIYHILWQGCGDIYKLQTLQTVW